MKFACKTCGVILSEELTKLEDLTLLQVEEDGRDYFPQGYYYLYDKKFKERMKHPKDYYLINILDLINAKNHSNPARLNGCCGLDGLDGLNKVCINDHEIGTELSDCWLLHYVELDPDLVVLVE